MSMFKKPYEREAKTTLNIMIYGRPGIGKTTLACSAPGVFLIDFDRGIDRVDAAYQAEHIAEPERWEDMQELYAELAVARGAKTLVIDTIGRLLDMVADYVKRTCHSLVQNDGSLSLKGYKRRNDLFKDFLIRINAMGISTIWISHETEEKQKINREEITTMRPNITGSNRNEVVQDLDLMGYMSMINGQRTITFDQNDNILAKNSRDIHGTWNATMRQFNAIEIPMLDGKMSNTFLIDVVFKANEAFLQKRKEEMEQYNELINVIEGMVESCTGADELNEVVAKVGSKSFEVLRDSTARAKTLISAKGKELGLTFNNKTKKYENI